MTAKERRLSQAPPLGNACASGPPLFAWARRRFSALRIPPMHRDDVALSEAPDGFRFSFRFQKTAPAEDHARLNSQIDREVLQFKFHSGFEA
jgi:hypothetical protein